MLNEEIIQENIEQELIDATSEAIDTNSIEESLTEEKNEEE